MKVNNEGERKKWVALLTLFGLLRYGKINKQAYLISHGKNLEAVKIENTTRLSQVVGAGWHEEIELACEFKYSAW